MKIIFLKSEQRNIEGKDYTKISVFEETTDQVFSFFKKTDEKVFNFIKNVKVGDVITDKLHFVIKKGQKITFDLN